MLGLVYSSKINNENTKRVGVFLFRTVTRNNLMELNKKMFGGITKDRKSKFRLFQDKK